MPIESNAAIRPPAGKPGHAESHDATRMQNILGATTNSQVSLDADAARFIGANGLMDGLVQLGGHIAASFDDLVGVSVTYERDSELPELERVGVTVTTSGSIQSALVCEDRLLDAMWDSMDSRARQAFVILLDPVG